MKSFPRAALGEIVQINPGMPRGQRPSDSAPDSFVPMAAVCEKSGRITNAEKRPFGQVAKGFTLFSENDILFAKITPCMENGKAAIARQLVNGQGAGSTEFFVFRPTQAVLPEFIYYFVRRSAFRASCKANFSGSAGQQRVPKSYLEKVPVPLPPLDDQRRIVGLLDRAAEIRRRADAARKKARAIIPALFLDTFGDPAANPNGWPVIPFSELVRNFRYGTNQKCSDKQIEDAVPVLRIPNVIGAVIDLRDLKYAVLPDTEMRKLSLLLGDLLFVRTNGNPDYVGRCAEFREERQAAYASYLIRARLSERMSPTFVCQHFTHPNYRPTVLRAGRTTAGNYNLSTEGLGKLPLIAPPLALQTAFAERVRCIEALARHLDAAAAKAEAMAAALSAEIFD